MTRSLVAIYFIPCCSFLHLEEILVENVMYRSYKKKEKSLYTLIHCHQIGNVELRDWLYFKFVMSLTLVITMASVQFSTARDGIKAQHNCGLAVGYYQ